jgi:hypothetical protein
LPTRYFFCHAGEPNFIRDLAFVLDDLVDLVDEAFRRRRRRPVARAPERAPSAIFEAGVICWKPAKPPGGTINDDMEAP